MSPLRFVAVPLMGCIFANSKKKCTRGSDVESSKLPIIQNLFKNYSAGIPEKGIQALDPTIIEAVEVNEKSSGIKTHLRNTIVSGFKDVVVSKLSEENDTIQYKLKFDVVAEGLISIEFLNLNKILTGTVRYEGGATGSVSHTFITKTTNSQEIYEIGPETLACECDDVKCSLSKELQAALTHDLDAQTIQIYEKIHKDHHTRVMCEIATVVFKRALETLGVLGED